jgi:hypothetical protein
MHSLAPRKEFACGRARTLLRRRDIGWHLAERQLLVAGLAIGMMIEDDGPSVLTYFHEELGIPVAWLSACTNYMESCFKDGGKLKFGPEETKPPKG